MGTYPRVLPSPLVGCETALRDHDGSVRIETYADDLIHLLHAIARDVYFQHARARLERLLLSVVRRDLYVPVETKQPINLYRDGACEPTAPEVPGGNSPSVAESGFEQSGSELVFSQFEETTDTSSSEGEAFRDGSLVWQTDSNQEWDFYRSNTVDNTFRLSGCESDINRETKSCVPEQKSMSRVRRLSCTMASLLPGGRRLSMALSKSSDTTASTLDVTQSLRSRTALLPDIPDLRRSHATLSPRERSLTPTLILSGFRFQEPASLIGGWIINPMAREARVDVGFAKMTWAQDVEDPLKGTHDPTRPFFLRVFPDDAKFLGDAVAAAFTATKR
ncbi:hypothetical protein KIPB_002875 [Kipferlia bialata]|uniref:Uncharacterized protein n=1 Tax=Kipferlia bialata TaxID=797122 RepID=A0A9K3CT40_9EUKA|nr:hypothetical protein KIPB_002875 [Kipferlia bialata]|eukprot:g2875.t1